MSQCAYRLGMAFGAVAQAAEDDPTRQICYFDLFERCFFAVRMAASLELRLGHSRTASSERQPRERESREQESREQERPGRERAERHPSERDIDRNRERERDREREPASIPILLKTLGAVVDDAATLPGPAPSALLTLRELLAQLTSDPAPTERSPASLQGLRTRLAGTAATAILPPPKPTLSVALHRATGPPRPSSGGHRT
jgi:hypothetical protein